MASSRLIYYCSLMDLSYRSLISHLLDKYGPVKDCYYKKESYERFMRNEIKNITEGKYQRTNDGLFCHHIMENRYMNLSNLIFIKKFKPPYMAQLAKNLVYCNLIEHSIIHYKISMESNCRFGFQGLADFLIPMVEEWYIDKKIPSLQWQKNCYHESYLTEIDAMILLSNIKNNLR